MTTDPSTIPETLVLGLPGGGVSPAIFEGCRLSAARLVALDWMALPGPGEPAAVADALAAALLPRERAGLATVLAGHSIGGVIAMLCAIRHPSRVQGLVISNTGPRIDGHGDPGLPQRIRDGWSSGERRAFLESCFEQLPPARMMTRLERWLAAIDTGRLLEAVDGLRRLDLGGDLPAITCPTLIAHGRNDRRRPPAAAEALARGIANATLVWLPGGHTPMVDAPAAWARAVDDFLVAHPFSPV